MREASLTAGVHLAGSSAYLLTVVGSLSTQPLSQWLGRTEMSRGRLCWVMRKDAQFSEV